MGVNVCPRHKRLGQRHTAAQVRQQAQFNLAVIRTGHHPAGLRHKRRPNLAPQRAADGNVLQIRVAGTKPPRRRTNLLVMRVHPPRHAVHLLHQRLAIGAFNLRQLPVRQQRRQQLPTGAVGGRLLGQFFQHVRRRAACLLQLGAAQFQVIKQHRRQLLGRLHIQRGQPRRRLHRLLQRGQLMPQPQAQRPQGRHVHPHAQLLHAHNHRQQRLLNLTIHPLHTVTAFHQLTT